MKREGEMNTILIMDDEASIRTVFKRYLEGHGYEVSLAANGKEGLRLLEERHHDLVITDIMMPEADGLEVLMAMREKARKIPIIAISGGMRSAPMDFLPVARKLGACKVLYKPVDLEHLLDAVKETLGNG